VKRSDFANPVTGANQQCPRALGRTQRFDCSAHARSCASTDGRAPHSSAETCGGGVLQMVNDSHADGPANRIIQVSFLLG
jgi:hypothetical protein